MKEKLKEYVPYVVLIIILLLIRTFVGTTIRVNGASMYPTLDNKDLMILDKISYRFKEIKRFDIVVVKTERSKIIKRVIGLPGEIISYKDNILYIDGEEVEDIYNSVKQDDFECVLGEDEYFVLGDNREISLDSRSIGPVEREDIVGRAIFTIFPFSKFGSVE